ncbi:hypothetical protein [Actinoplanes aureus]|uniref:Lipoprotein n=1 Tax=Actinoplanes aureus TaxID=2792083 RepID=A0A931FXV5_9ACTN|nr:hypothetical protein [Actinoplanes aureus]MBG0562905.1 hypothetical protein [Actinoplanes aureus]
MRAVATLAALLLLAGCSDDDRAGFGHLDMDDLRHSSLSADFGGPAQSLKAELTVRPNGCVHVVVDGVERHPFWPDGTEVSSEEGVELPGGLTLAIGDEFTASGVVAVAGSPAPASTDPPGKAESLLAFCEVEAAPVAFPDAATFVP